MTTFDQWETKQTNKQQRGGYDSQNSAVRPLLICWTQKQG